MPNSQRHQLLAALGVVQYLPRDRWQLPVSVDLRAPRPNKLAAPAAQALLAELQDAAPAERSAPPAPAVATQPPALEPAALVAPSSETAGEPFKLAFWQAGDEWLFIADVSARLPSSAEQKLLANIARAARAPALAPLELIEWPLAGSVAAVSEDPRGEEFLAVLFEARWQSRPSKRIAWLAAEERPLEQALGAPAVATMAGLLQLQLPSLAAMVADPSLKAACWSLLRPHLAPLASG